MAIQKTEAIVLRTQQFRSTSLIVTFFTKDFGKIRGIVKGVRDERQTRAPVFELFNRLEIIYYEKLRSDLQLVSDYFILDAYGLLRTKLESIGYASYFVELVDKLSELYDPHSEVFELLDFGFKYLTSLPGERISRIFEVKLLNEIGWLPFLQGCIECGNSHVQDGFFSSRQGGLICDACAGKYPDAIEISADCLRVIRYYIRHTFNDSIKQPLTSAAERNLQVILHRFFLERMDRPLKSRQFLDLVKIPLKSL